MKYKVFFSIDFLHDYYSDSHCSDFEVVPTDATMTLMNGLGMLWKKIGYQFIVLIPVDLNDKPFKIPAASNSWKFYLRPLSTGLFNYTNMNLSSKGRFYFNNLNENKLDSTLYLTKKIEVYNSSQDYLPSGFASDASGNIFEALKSSNNSDQHSLGETDYWLNRGKKEYVNNSDLLIITNSSYLFETSAPSSQFNATVSKLNIANGLYDIPVMNSLISTSDLQSSIIVNLESFSPGKYKIEVNGENHFVYYDNHAVYSRALAVIEIFNHLDASNVFSLIDSSGIVKGSRFTIYFANRLAIWKYLTKTDDVTAINDSSSTYIFSESSPQEFISNNLIPILETPIKTFSLTSTKIGQVNSIANPDAGKLKTILKDGDTLFCTEIYLNY